LVYKERPLKRKYVPDLFVADALVVELKAHAALNADHEAQLFNYMRIAHQPVGYLINFGNKEKLEWKRFILSDLRTRQTGNDENTNLR
jgi:GxxExxY protein